ncbi:ecdysone-induced protein 75B, isoforms C/D isoform X2 [Eurosta solidaginis]|uniref:ecdysone-induced protein 75B, isoforms C/D isoform X2 n=1 Tax=Eurosta solidaginis TaxID=178769 RepID=UPI00353107F3
MVCATQELTANDRQDDQHSQLQCHAYQLQMQATSPSPQLKPYSMRPAESELTKMLLRATPSGNIQQISTHLAETPQRLPTTKSQLLKQKHSALVKLLESEPVTKKQVSKTEGTGVSASNILTENQIEHQNSVRSDDPKQYQLKHDFCSTECERLTSTGISPSLLIEPRTSEKNRVETDIVNIAEKSLTDSSNIGKDAIIENKDIDDVSKKKSKEIIVDISNKKPQETIAKAASHNMMSVPPVNASNFTTNSDCNEQYQCPWKKIRFAREWKQREQLQKEKQSLIKTENHYKRNESIDENIAKMIFNEVVATADLNLSEETQKEITVLLQQHRRDSSDSNSSLLSSSSNQSSTSLNTSFCKCVQQSHDNAIETDTRTSFCQCSDCHPKDIDSSCGDELCDIHGKPQQLSFVEQSAMNDLCQKFDENLETYNKFPADCRNESITNNESVQLPNKYISHISSKSGKTNCETAITDGFFRRSIQQKIQYRPCTKNQQCSILRINRNRCQYCRLKKCIAVGMSRDAVRFGRVPKREKARILAAMQQSTQNRGQQRALAGELDDQPRLIAAVLRAHLETCEFTKEKVATMRQRARECPSYSMPTLLACPLNPAPELQSEQEFSQRFAHVIRGVIDFAGMIPGFQLLSQDDKFTLLKAGLFDALFVRLICMFDSSINSIICLNGQVMRRDAIQNGANARFLVDSTFNFAERMNLMNLSDAEIGLFCAIVLITPDRPGLRNIELIEKMYSRLKGCLQKVIIQNRADQPDFMSKLLDTMPDLRTLSTLHTEKLVVFRTEHKELLRQQMWTMDDERPIGMNSPVINWDDPRMDVEAKSPLGSVSSTESGDIEYSSSAMLTSHQQINQQGQQPSALASSAPLLAATLSGTCPIRNRANSGSSGDSTADMDIVGSHSHLTQNGLTITPIVRSHSHQQLHHHLTSGTPNRYRKLDSPTDSGIESGNEKNDCGIKAASSGGSSSCSSPRSSVDDALDCTDTVAASTNQVTITVSPIRSPQPKAPIPSSSSAPGNMQNTLKRQIVEDMPVLKRVLQAPPLYDTNSLMDEAYKPHKKFRALRHREFETAETDPSSTSNGSNCAEKTTTSIQTNNSVQSSQKNSGANSPPLSSQTYNTSTSAVVVSQSAIPPSISPNVSSPAPIAGNFPQQSQLQMHLTRQGANICNNGSGSENNNGLIHPQQSSLSSTHSVLAKSLMAEPRMTPEQIKRSDIIKNYIMRDSTSACSGNRSPAPTQHLTSLNQNSLQYNSSASPSSANSPACSSSSCVSPSTLASPPPPSAMGPITTRWQSQSVITTSISHRQQSVSPSSNGSGSSSSNSCQYFQSPHSTSNSVSSPRPSPSTVHTTQRLLELQVDIADSQQPLNLSKKSPTPPPNKMQALVAAATAAQRYPNVSADVTVTPNSSEPQQTATNVSINSKAQLQVHKVMLEA